MIIIDLFLFTFYYFIQNEETLFNIDDDINIAVYVLYIVIHIFYMNVVNITITKYLAKYIYSSSESEKLIVHPSVLY